MFIDVVRCRSAIPLPDHIRQHLTILELLQCRLDEIDDVPPGQTKQLSIDLAKGNYVVICNMVHVEADGSIEVHYQLGMHEAFRVE